MKTARAVSLLHSVTVILVCGPLPRLRGLEAIAQKSSVMVILVRGWRHLAHSIATARRRRAHQSMTTLRSGCCERVDDRRYPKFESILVGGR